MKTVEEVVNEIFSAVVGACIIEGALLPPRWGRFYVCDREDLLKEYREDREFRWIMEASE